ncbi:MAG: hypothetical protein H3C47_06125 [Candidatus Cloacimonetes bacterium]|nr:hypothetical protein [Candidatus Cloacimonadota bacterium]
MIHGFRLVFLALIIHLPLHASFKEKWADLKESLEPANIEKRVREKVTSLDIGFGLDLLDVDLFNGVGLAAKYRYEVEPSYREEWYTRVDKWVVNTSIRPGDWLSEFELPIGLTISNGAEMVFVRQFKSQKEALKALPYSPKHLPVSAERALSQLNPGDFAAIPAKMNLLVSANVSAGSGIFNGNLGTHYLLSGEFQIQVFRLRDDRMRVKLIALRKKGQGANASVGMDFKIFGISVVDKQVKKLLDMNLAQFGIQKEEGNLFLLDYIFDLKQDEARKAFDHLLAGTLKFKNAQVLNPFLDGKELHDTVLTDLTMAEALHEEDLEKDVSKRRVDRIFKGQNDFKTQSSRLKLGMSLAKFENKNAYTSNQIAWFGRDGLRQDYLYPVYSHEKKRSFFFGVFKSQQVESYFALFPTDGSGQVQDFSDYGYNYELKDKTLFGYEVTQLREGLNRILPANTPVQYGDWEESSKRENARVKMEIFFHKEAVNHLVGMTEDQLYAKMAEYLRRLPDQRPPHNSESDHTRPFPGRKWSNEKKAALKVVLDKYYDNYWFPMIKMVEKLARILAPTGVENYNKRVEELFELRKNYTYEHLGIGFLISLLPESEISKLMYMAVDWTASGIKPFQLRLGDHKNSLLYEELQMVQNILNDRGVDLSLGDNELPPSDGLVEKRTMIFEELYGEVE